MEQDKISERATPGASRLETAFREGFGRAWGEASCDLGYAAREDRAWKKSETRAALRAQGRAA